MCNCSQIEILYNERHSWTQLRVLQRFCLAFCGGNMVSDGEHNSSGCLVIAALFQSLTKNGKSFSISYPSRKILVRSKWFKVVEPFANQNWPCSSWGCPLHIWGRPSCRGRRWHSPRSKESTGGESLRNKSESKFCNLRTRKASFLSIAVTHPLCWSWSWRAPPGCWPWCWPAPDPPAGPFLGRGSAEVLLYII